MNVISKEMDFLNRLGSFMYQSDSTSFFSLQFRLEKITSFDRDDYKQNAIYLAQSAGKDAKDAELA